jgi:hypothetical protein
MKSSPPLVIRQKFVVMRSVVHSSYSRISSRSCCWRPGNELETRTHSLCRHDNNSPHESDACPLWTSSFRSYSNVLFFVLQTFIVLRFFCRSNFQFTSLPALYKCEAILMLFLSGLSRKWKLQLEHLFVWTLNDKKRLSSYFPACISSTCQSLQWWNCSKWKVNLKYQFWQYLLEFQQLLSYISKNKMIPIDWSHWTLVNII